MRSHRQPKLRNSETLFVKIKINRLKILNYVCSPRGVLPLYEQ